MISPPSVLSLSAASLYAVVVLACLAAAVSAPRRPPQTWHMIVWLMVGAVFVLLAVSRIYGLEEAFRATMRSDLRAEHAYSERREFQRPIAALAVAFIGAGAFAMVYRSFRKLKGRANLAVQAAVMGTFGLAGLVVLRLISLSPVDKLLYGPLKLNWIVDVGLSGLTISAAAYYIRVLRDRRSR